MWEITSLFVFFFFVTMFFCFLLRRHFFVPAVFLHCHWHHHPLWCWHCQRPRCCHWCLDRQPFDLRAPTGLICLALQLCSRLRWRPKILNIYNQKNKICQSAEIWHDGFEHTTNLAIRCEFWLIYVNFRTLIYFYRYQDFSSSLQMCHHGARTFY